MEGVETPSVSRRGIWGWMLFDWAAQPFHTLIVTFVFAPYFAATVASNATLGQEMWGYATGVAGMLIAFMSPVLGAIADASGPRKPWIAIFTAVGFAGCWLLWYAVPGGGNFALVFFAIILAFIGLEFAAVFNNAMMPDLVPRSELGRLSGSAWGLGYVGGLISLVIMLGFMVAQPATGRTLIGVAPLFGLDPAMHEGSRVSGPFTAIWLVIFILPLFAFTPDIERRPAARSAVRGGLVQLAGTLKSLPRQRSYFSFLLASMFYRDALNALYAFGGIYAAGVLQWSITQIGIFGILANITGALGAWIGGKIDQRLGPKFVVAGCILILALASLIVISTTTSQVLFMPTAPGGLSSSLPDVVFYLAGGLIGAAGGSMQAASRTLLVDQVPRPKVTEAFGLYALSGKATSFIGPLSIAWATGFFQSQRLGVTPIIVLFIVGLMLLPFVVGHKPGMASS
jgi:UMF1 family MFS transporter